MYYLNQPNYQPPYCYSNYWPIRQYQSIDPSFLYQSANESKKLMKDASMVLNKLSDSKEFDAELMYAAQSSDIVEVKRLINSIGVTSDVDINYNPDGLRLEFASKVDNTDCCRLSIALRWR
ncbi:hypothetical protein [Gracilibacillus saliphilus]|uniref:hypothetical protein n=1 Tax=Gracilibacillus saliphilus TaxID=543890 RepID=UPI0013D62512|nr:hypothetical protein [Gracilibacillus saliphilus]